MPAKTRTDTVITLDDNTGQARICAPMFTHAHQAWSGIVEVCINDVDYAKVAVELVIKLRALADAIEQTSNPTI